MCGRFGNGRDGSTLAADLAADWHGASWRPRWNVAPTNHAPVLLLEDGARVLRAFRWGLCVGWAKAKGLKQEPINARSEQAAWKPFFRSAFRARRCLVTAEGFYEWQPTPTGKVPHWIHPGDGSLLTFAALWESWRPAAAETVLSFVILTTAANEGMRSIHDRMPCIVSGGDRDAWMHPSTPPDRLQALLDPFPGSLRADPVAARVNSPRNDGPDLIVPVAARPAELAP